MQSSLFLAVLLLAVFASVASPFPWDPDFILKQHLATKSPYWPLGDVTQHPPAPATCTPIHFNLITRHGNRNPGDSDVEEYERIQRLGGFYGNRLTYEWMRSFVSPVEMEDEGRLVLGGQLEMYNAAKRYSKVFPEIFSREIKNDVFFMRATQEQRAMMSGRRPPVLPFSLWLFGLTLTLALTLTSHHPFSLVFILISSLSPLSPFFFFSLVFFLLCFSSLSR